MGKKGKVQLVYPKNSGSLKLFDEAISMVINEKGNLKMDKFLSEINVGNAGRDKTSLYHKTVMPRYFGMLEYDKTEKVLKLTNLGMAYICAISKASKIDIIMQALESIVFGRNNNAIDSNSDVEAPILFLKTIYLMEKASLTQIGSVLYFVEVKKNTLEDAIEKVLKEPNINDLKNKIIKEIGTKFYDLKFNVLFEELGIVNKDEDKNYYLSNYINNNYIETIKNLKEIFKVDKLSGNVSEWAPTIEEYSTGLSVDQWKNILAENESKSINSILTLLNNNNRVSDYVTMSRLLTKNVMADSLGECGFLCMKICKEMNIRPFKINGVDNYLSLMFQGKVELIKGQPLYFLKLREEVNNAIQELKLTNIKNENIKNNRTINYYTGLDIKGHKRNKIYFGAPGTGKSHTLNEEKQQLLQNKKNYERVTFHPDYSYAHFVGSYKPVSKYNEKTNMTEIEYKYVPGPFLRTLAKALNSGMSDNPEIYILIIEEINRANVAAVFGDIFQLLDRKKGVSEYPIHISEEMRYYLSKALNISAESIEEIKIPDNMLIWATMNSADQGVFPMDTAFKRRWDFTYIGIDEAESKIQDKVVTLGDTTYKWNSIRKGINACLSSMNINEDKLLGPYFINMEKVENEEDFDEIFKNKVLMYLYEDAGRQRRNKIFKENLKIYSSICKEYDNNKLNIFMSDILKIIDEYEKE